MRPDRPPGLGLQAESDGPAFPGWAHVPGLTPGADHGPLERAKACVPARFAGPPTADHPAIRYGVALCDAGFYWEAHEVLEAVWMATALNTRERIAVRAAIQLANAGLKLRMERPRAALRLLREVRELLGELTRRARPIGFGDQLDAVALGGDVDRLISSVAGGLGGRVPALAPYLETAVRNAV